MLCAQYGWDFALQGDAALRASPPTSQREGKWASLLARASRSDRQHFIRRNQWFADSSLEGSGFELPVPRCALIANSAALVAPPDSAVRGGSLNGRLQPRSVVGRQLLG